MEISIDTILNIAGWLFGGGALGGILTWRFTRRKAKAEAEAAEAEASEKKQDYYQQIIEDVAKDRDYYKTERNELRTRLDEMDEKFRTLQYEVARNGRMVESLRPFICTNLKCKLRQRGVISADGEIKAEVGKEPKITPYGPKTEDT